MTRKRFIIGVLLAILSLVTLSYRGMSHAKEIHRHLGYDFRATSQGQQGGSTGSQAGSQGGTQGLAPSHQANKPGARNTANAKAKSSRETLPATRDAIVALKLARSELEQSPSHFGGHKDEAIKAVDQAIDKLTLALKSDEE